jgi:ParB-like chromosome segregation protein Spo0J
MADENKADTEAPAEVTAPVPDVVTQTDGNWPEEKLPLDLIEADRDLQARVRINEDHIENNLMPAVERGQRRAGGPAVVFHETIEVPPEKEGGKPKREDHYWLADGFQWLEAHKRLGKRGMVVQVRDGSRLDALKYAVAANSLHGLPRTTADKERAVTLCLENEELRKKSTKSIAKLCQVSEGLAAKVRKSWEEANKSKVSQRVGADNRVRKSSIVRRDAVERKRQKEVIDQATKIATARDPAKLTSPEPGKTRVRGITDYVSREVPEVLAHVFHGITKIDAVKHILQNAEAQVKALRDNGILPYLAKSFENALSGAISDLEYAKPAVVCKECGGDGCKECRVGDHAVGFLSVGEYTRLSKAEKEAYVRAVEEDADDAGDLGPEVTAEDARQAEPVAS